MSNERKNMSIDIVDDLIKSLLAKTEYDENLEIELNGYPADYLDDPTDIGDSAINEEYNSLIDGNRYLGFVYCYTGQSGFKLGDILNTEEPQYLLDFGMKKAWIDTKKLRSLIKDNSGNGWTKQTRNGIQFFIKVPVQLLLDSASTDK